MDSPSLNSTQENLIVRARVVVLLICDICDDFFRVKFMGDNILEAAEFLDKWNLGGDSPSLIPLTTKLMT